MKKVAFISITLGLLFAFSAGATNLITGHVIALDAGHGAGGATGAIGGCDGTPVVEAEVNLVTRDALKAKLVAGGVDEADVFMVPQYSSRKDRVAAAEAAGAEVLISIHHNGSLDETVNYTRSFITQGSDKKLATPVHDALVEALELDDRGIKHDGFGITVYGNIPGVLTESYFITYTAAACDFLADRDLVEIEAQAMYDGLSTYFANLGGGDDEERNSCPPGKQKQGKC